MSYKFVALGKVPEPEFMQGLEFVVFGEAYKWFKGVQGKDSYYYALDECNRLRMVYCVKDGTCIPPPLISRKEGFGGGGCRA